MRTGGRSARVREAVLAAVLDQLVVDGPAALSVEAIASAAGVNKTTVYRRWPTLDDLLVDALIEWSHVAIPDPDTGRIDADLLALGREIADQLNTGVGRQIVAVVLTRGLRSAKLRETTRRYFEHQSERTKPVVARAVERGELAADTDTDALLSTFRAPLFYRLVTTGDPIDDDLIAHTTQITLTAARAGLLSTSSRRS